MAATFKVPTIFSAIDKVSAVVNKMQEKVHTFARTMERGISRGERAFRRFKPTISAASRELFAFAKAAAIASAILATANFSVQSIKDYESAVASFRTIVSDATDNEFSAYRKAINDVARDTRKSSVDVAKSFENIAGLNEKFAETAEGIGQVSKSAIILSKASRDDLGTSAENLVGIMNQFDFAANQADRTINVLAAGQAVGAASISRTAESFKNFGSVASGANITLEESVALIQTVGKFSIFGAEAGTKLRGSVLKLQQAGVGYASGQFNINDALAEANKRISRLTTQKARDAAMTKIFGAENITVGRILLSNIDTFQDYTKGVTGTTEASKAAAINSATLTVKLDEMRNRWVNIITSSDKAGSSLTATKKAVGFVTDNMDTMIFIGSSVLLFFVAWKVLLIAGRTALIAYNVALGITGALSGTASIAIGRSAIALGAYKATLAVATAAQWLLNAAITANPIGIIIVAIAGLIALVVTAIAKWDEWGAALVLITGPLGVIINMIMSFRRNWDMIVESFKQGGILGGLKAIGKAILDSILMPVQQVLELAAKIPGMGWADAAAKNIQLFRDRLGVNTEEVGSPGQAPAVNPKVEQQESQRQMIKETTNNAKIGIDIRDPTGRARPVVEENNGVNIRLTSTMAGAFG